MFELSIKVSSIEEAERILACLRHDAAPAVVEQINAQVETKESNAEVEKPKNPRGRPRREVAPPIATESAAPASVGDTSTEQLPGEPSGAPAQQTLTLDDAKRALMDVQARYGTADMAKPLELLAKFNAARVSEIKPSDYPAFVAACKAA